MAGGFDVGTLVQDLGPAALEALVDTMVLAAEADGEIADEERSEMLTRLSQLTRGSALADSVATGAPINRFETTLQRIEAGERAAVLEGVRQSLAPGDARKAALGLAVAIMAADGIVRTSEREVIMELAEALEIDRDEAADLVVAVTRGDGR